MPEPKLYSFSTHIGAACARKMVPFFELADRLRMDVHQLMREVNAKAAPSKSLVKGLARELDIMSSISISWRRKVRKDLG
jgi:hypothetical protein